MNEAHEGAHEGLSGVCVCVCVCVCVGVEGDIKGLKESD